MITPESRIEDLEKVLTANGLMMTAVATAGVWTVALDTRHSLQHYIGSGGSLFEALRRALDKVEKGQISNGFSPETRFNGESRGRK